MKLQPPRNIVHGPLFDEGVEEPAAVSKKVLHAVGRARLSTVS